MTPGNSGSQANPAIHDLITSNLALCGITASTFRHKLPGAPGLEMSDLVSIGYLGLLKAAESYDPSRATSFRSWAITKIRGEIFEAFRNENWAPRLVMDRWRAQKDAETRLSTVLGRDPLDEEVAADLGIPLHALDKWRSDARLNLTTSLQWLTGFGKDIELGSLIADDAASPEEQASEALRHQAMAAAIGRLPDRERHVLALYYFDDKTFKEISLALEISESRAYQLHGQAIKRLRSDGGLREAMGWGESSEFTVPSLTTKST